MSPSTKLQDVLLVAQAPSCEGAVAQLTARVGWQQAVVAMANKNARILWAVLDKARRFDPDHISLSPAAPATAARN